MFEQYGIQQIHSISIKPVSTIQINGKWYGPNEIILYLTDVEAGKLVEEKMLKVFNELSQQALKITMELNNKYHTPEEIVELFSKLTGKKVDKSGNTLINHPLFDTGQLARSITCRLIKL